MLIPNRKQGLFISPALDFGQELGKFVMAAQVEYLRLYVGNTIKFPGIFETLYYSALTQGLTKTPSTFILHGSLFVVS